jgi:hypothetical protein
MAQSPKIKTLLESTAPVTGIVDSLLGKSSSRSQYRLSEASLSSLPRAKNAQGKTLVFFKSVAHLKKELIPFLPANTTIKTKKYSFFSIGFNSSIEFTFGIDGRNMPTMGSPEAFLPYKAIQDGLREFRLQLSGTNITIAIGEPDNCDIVTGI